MVKMYLITMSKLILTSDMRHQWYEQGICFDPKTGTAGQPDKGAIKELVVSFSWDVSAFGPAKRSGRMLLSTVPLSMDGKVYVEPGL